MTNAELIQTIRAEIERNRQAIRVLNEHTAPEQTSKTCAIFQYSDTILFALLSFLSTIETEKPNDKVVEGEVILNGHGLLVDVTKWGDGYKLKVIIKEN